MPWIPHSWRFALHRYALLSSRKRMLLVSVLIFLILFSAVIAPLAVSPVVSARASSNPNPPIAVPGWLKPQQPHTPPLAFPYHYVTPDPTYRYIPKPHSWPVTMKPATLTLTTGPVHFLSNDGRLEVNVPAGTFDTTALAAVGGSITLKITQLLPGAGGLRNEHIFFGTYQLQLLDSSGKPITSLALLHPITFAYHLLPSQAELVWYGQEVYAILHDGDPSLLPGATPTATVQPSTASRLLVASPDATGLVYRVSSDLTLGDATATASPFAMTSSNVTFGTQAPQALWGTPQNSQVDLNSGGLIYHYPFNLPPGPGGLVPQLGLTYTSGSVDESHNLQASAPWVGGGWNLSLGSISWSQENVTPGGTNHIENVWQFNDPSGISGQLIPPNLSVSTIPPYSPALASLGTNTIWQTAPDNHARIEEVEDPATNSYPCFRAYFPSGVMEEFGCNDTVGSDQSFKDSSGNWNRYRWDLDLIVDRYGNQIHFNYQRIWDPTHSWIQDAVLSDVQYDDPSCHQQTACTTWNPKVDIHFDAATAVQHLLNSPCTGWNNAQFRCDNPITVSGGLSVPKVLNSHVLNDVKVEVQGNILHEYVFNYTQSKPQTITDPATGQQESISGYLNLNQVQEEGTGGTLLNAPVINLTYAVKSLHYIDEWQSAVPASNCGPDNWVPGYSVQNCVLWSRTYNSWYLTNLDNGRGWNETISWTEGHNNTHGVDSGAINEPATCNSIRTSTNRCGQADDRNWSHYMVTQVQTNSNGEQSTWSYKYWIQQGLSSNYVGTICDQCGQGYSWGNQNDNDYADYYNGQFESYFRVQVTQPDHSFQAHLYDTTTGWGLAESGFTCAPTPATCSVAPYFTNAGSLAATALAGHEYIEYDFDPNGNELAVHTQTYTPNCKPTGLPVSGGGPPWNPGDQYLISQLDQNNPVVVCDPRTTQEDSYRVDGVLNTTTEDNYATDARVVHKTTTYSYDTDNQGVAAYDYGNPSNTDVTGNDVGGSHIVTHTTFYPNNTVASGIYLTNLPAIMQTRDGSGTPLACSQSIYGSNTNATTAPTLPEVTQDQAYTLAGTGGCTGSSNLISTQHSYDAIGNAITAIDPDNHLGCTSGSTQYSACAVYDSATYDTHLTSATNARNQATTYSYDTTSSGGFGQWLTGETDPNGQITTYQYDALGRLTAIIRPGDSTGSPTVSYTYTNTCSQGSTAPCLELDTATRFTVGGPTSTMKQWYDGRGNLVETQTPSPNSGQTIITYTVYYNDATNGSEVVKSLPYAIATPSGYVAPDLTKARSVTRNDGLGRSLGSVTYSDATTIVLSTSLSYTVAQGVTGFSGESSTAYEQTITLDAYNHQSIAYTDALGRGHFSQLFSGTASPYSVVRTVENTYDLLGDPTLVQTFDSSATLQASYSAVFDALKRRTGFNDADLGSCSNTPLPAGCSSSGDTAWKFTYDADGNQLSQTDPRNKSVYTSYNVLDRPLCRGTASTDVNPCQSSAYAKFFYDSYDNTSNPGMTFPAGCTAPTPSEPVGRTTAEVFSNSVGSGWRCSGFDARGQQSKSMLSVTADGTTTTQTMQMSYNDGGEITALTYPDGETLTSQYDVNGRIQAAYFGTSGTPDPVNFLVGQVSYTDNGLMSGMGIGGSGPKAGIPTPVLSAAYSYDGIQRLLSTNATETTQPFWNEVRTYDNVGNVLGVSTTVPVSGGGTKQDNEAFCYDALNRLAWAGNSGTPTGGDHCDTAPGGTTTTTYQQAYGYDSLDRLTSGAAGTLTYGASGHVHAVTGLSQVPNRYAVYNAMGNMTCRNVDPTTAHTCGGGTPTGASMSYDNEGRLTGWTAPSGSSATDGYLYDNEGNRVLQRTNDATGITDTITYDGYTETTIHGSTTTVTKYYSVNGQRVGVRIGGTLDYLLTDLLGGTAVALNTTGTVLAVNLYQPYGAVGYSWGTMPTTYNYTGQRLDNETGLLYYNFRYYDPVSGRFVRSDTMQGNASGMDPYAYVGDNPEGRTDPTGHCWPWCTALIGAVIGAVVNVAVTTVTAAAQGRAPTGGELLQSAAVGAVSGAIMGVVGPEAGPLARVAVGALANGAGQMVGNLIARKPVMDGVEQAVIAGAVTGGLMEGGSVLFNRFAGQGLRGVTATLVDGIRSLTTKVGDFTGLAGSDLQDVIDRLPSSAVKQDFRTTPDIPQGYKWTWTDDSGNPTTLYAHAPNARAPLGSNSASGWTFRITRLNAWMQDDGTFIPGNVGYYSNDTHIPINGPR